MKPKQWSLQNKLSLKTMENSATTIEKLIEKAEIYSKTTLELCKYEAVEKSADIFSNLAVKLAIAIIVVLFLLLVNIGLALCVGQYLGETYLGFFLIAFGYLCLTILLYIFREEWIKNPVSNFIINKMKN
jgi:type IV secretory pathway TrbL component